jgi:uncharacterized DUF497 family protein
MTDEEFEWDEQKAESNYAKHGITFEMARLAFQDPFAIEFTDERQDYGEERFQLIGMSAGVLLFVAYSMRGETIRIISARGAEPFERRWYYEGQH